MEGNLAAFVDRKLLGGHTWKPLYDPEGILSTLPAIATTLSGVLAGHWLRSGRAPLEKVGGLFFAGACCVAVGWGWHFWFPINKAVGPSSSVLLTAGMALHLLALAVALFEMLRKPLRLGGFLRLEKLDDGARGVHPPGRVDPRPHAEAEVGGAHAAPVAAAGDFE